MPAYNIYDYVQVYYVMCSQGETFGLYDGNARTLRSQKQLSNENSRKFWMFMNREKFAAKNILSF